MGKDSSPRPLRSRSWAKDASKNLPNKIDVHERLLFALHSHALSRWSRMNRQNHASRFGVSLGCTWERQRLPKQFKCGKTPADLLRSVSLQRTEPNAQNKLTHGSSG